MFNPTFFSCLTCDAPEAWQIALSEPASITMEGILIFNNHLLFLLIVITLFVCWLLYNTIFFYEEFNNKFNSKGLEIVWTTIPAIILLTLSTPSFTLLYAMDKNVFCFDFSATNLLLINIFTLFVFNNIIYFLSSNEDYFKRSPLFFIPNNWQILIERLYEVVSKLLFDNISSEGEKYFSFISIIFTFILFSSLIGLIPYQFPLNCCYHDWETDIGTYNTEGSDIMLGILFISVVLFYLMFVVYYSKKRRTVLTVIIDNYIKLAVGTINKKIPRRFVLISAGFGSLIVRLLFGYKYISFQIAVTLMFIVPVFTFLFSLLLLILPFYIVAGYPNTWGKTFYTFLARRASKEGLEILMNRKIQLKPGQMSIPKAQKRNYHSSSKLGTSISNELMQFLLKLPKITNPKHLQDYNIIRDVLRASYAEGKWSEMNRSYPLVKAKTLLDQAYGSSASAANLVPNAVGLKNEFAAFRSPRGMIQLAVENRTNDLLLTVPQLLGLPEGVVVLTYLREQIIQGVGEAVVNPDILFSLGTIVICGVGVVTLGYYRHNSNEVLARVEEYVREGIVFDFENVVIEELDDGLIQNYSSLSDNSDVIGNSFLRRSLSESDLSIASNSSGRSLSSIVNLID